MIIKSWLPKHIYTLELYAKLIESLEPYNFNTDTLEKYLNIRGFNNLSIEELQTLLNGALVSAENIRLASNTKVLDLESEIEAINQYMYDEIENINADAYESLLCLVAKLETLLVIQQNGNTKGLAEQYLRECKTIMEG